MHESIQEHPSTERLEAFTLGRLGEHELASIGDHLTACASCCQRLGETPACDPLITKLRDAVVQDASTPEQPDARRSAVFALRGGLPHLGASSALHVPNSPTVSSAGMPKRIDQYLILKMVGRGGMGIVYQARDERLNRLAAIKMVLTGEFASAEQLLRFRLEAEMAARVRHPNVVRVYEVGEYHSRPFLALEWVDGGTLRDRLRDQKLPAQVAAELMECLARAVHAAHCQGIVHRDLKPANILLRDERNPVQGDGAGAHAGNGRRSLELFPLIADFGLARIIEHDSGLTATGVTLGTPEYMAPEQASGLEKNVGPQADVYALGAILYELLAGNPPFRGSTSFETVKQVLEAEAAPLRGRCPRDLETIALKCLRKAPAGRYATAEDVAGDLRRYLNGEPIQARPTGIVERVVKWARRRPTIAASLAAVVGTLLAAVGVSTYFGLAAVKEARDAEEAKNQAIHAAEREIGLRHAADIRVYAAQMAMAHHAWGDCELRRAQDLLDACCPAPGQPDMRGWEWQYVNRLCNGELMRLSGHDGIIFAVAFSPDGKLIASAGGGNLYYGTSGNLRPGQVLVRDAKTGQVLHRWTNFAHLVSTLAFSSDSRLLAIGSHDGYVSVHELPSGRQAHRFDPGGLMVTAVAFEQRAKNPRLMISTGRANAGGGDRTIRIWDLQKEKELLRMDGAGDSIGPATLAPAGDRVIFGWRDAVVCRDCSTGSVIWRRTIEGGWISKVIFDHAGGRLAALSDDGRVNLLDPADGRVLLRTAPRSGPLIDAAFSPDSKRLATVGVTPEICLWDLPRLELVGSIRGPRDIIQAVAFSPDGTRLATGDHEGLVKVWDASGDQRGKLHIVGRYSARTDLHFNEDGSKLFESLGTDWRLDTIDYKTGLFTTKSLSGQRGKAYATFSSPDGRWFAGVETSKAEDLNLWDTTHDDGPHVIPGGSGKASTIRFAADSQFFVVSEVETLAVGDAKNRFWKFAYHLRVRDSATGNSLQLIEDGRELTVRRSARIGNSASLAISPDGNLIAHAGFLDHIRVWDRRTGQMVAELGEPGVWGRSLTFSSDGRFFAAHLMDRNLTVWNVNDWTERCRMGYKAPYPMTDVGLALSPDGRRLALSDIWGVTRLWETDTGLPIFDLRGLGPAFGTVDIRPMVAFDPTGNRLASFNNNDTTNLFDATLPTTITDPN